MTDTIRRWILSLSLLLAASTASAQTAPDFNVGGAGNNDLFQGLINIMDDWAAFVSGPLAILIVFVALFICGVLWIISPRAGELIGYFIRIVIVGFAMFNVGTIIRTLMV